jgi:hypothetical protein
MKNKVSNSCRPVRGPSLYRLSYPDFLESRVMAYLKLPFRQTSGETKENHEDLYLG